MLPRDAVPAGPLVLRELTVADADAVTSGCSDPEIARFIPAVPSPYTLDDAHTFITKIAPDLWDRGGACFAISDSPAGAWLGTVSLKPPDVRGNGEVGYMVAPWARRRGVASAAARALAEWAFAQGVARVELVADVDNPASQRVAVAAGFRYEGVQRGASPLRDGGRGDVASFARLADDPGEPGPRYLPDFPGGSLSDGVVEISPLTLADADGYQEMMGEPEAMAYSVPPEPPDMEETLRRCRYTPLWWLTGERAEMGVRDALTGELAGHLQLMNVVPPLGQAMIGYNLARRFRGRGFMTRSVGLLTEWAFGHTALHRLVAGTAVGNTASQRVLERAGFTREALIRSLLPSPDGGWDDDVQWVLLRD
ncbi:GNAT family N-acetyltransferase [Sphaerisporangium sp. TRM90804]|uniref:GNAT family N-acetyltransferase n=1 Tax=Sphaerisporangium sp. TRM90804 TaxID=3031113 RepID=UPI002447CEDB|nr:GNAT family N-acetyltransferase [Sphaerisporangium sp. TRM90804]MDH2430669.1 GNAT family N-acetyltransferase [Sphaerisporangium sp. TRM90804]